MSKKNVMPVFERVALTFTENFGSEKFRSEMRAAYEEAKRSIREGPNKLSDKQLKEGLDAITKKWIGLVHLLIKESATLQGLEWLVYGENYELWDEKDIVFVVKEEKLN